MSKSKKKQPQTIADKVTKLLAHPNDSDSDDESDIDVSTATRLVEFDDEYDLPDARSSDFRKRNVKLLSEQSERYKGKISSRKELEEEEEESDDEVAYEESDTDEEESAAMEAFSKKLKVAKSANNDDQSEDSSLDEYQKADTNDDEDSGEDEQEDEDDDDDDDDDGEDDEEDDDGDDSEEENDDAMDTSGLMTQSNQQAEIQKGVCVQNQLRIWERLLELRINTQKITTKANLLPPPETLQVAKASNEELQTVLAEAEGRSSKLLQQLLALQAALLQQNSEMRQTLKRPPPQTAEENGEPSSKRFAKQLQTQFQGMRQQRNEVLLKWDDRTKLLTPGAGVKRKSLQEDYDILKKMDSSLANRQALVEKSQTLKNSQQQQPQRVEGGEETEQIERNPNIYDDSDFYHQQLRELIEYKASTTSNMSDITKQFVELQKLRQKMKKKVDTRASKGRKLRYVVHNKLINFMAPNDSSDWTEAKTELYKSLFV
ncbi:protein Aatf [Drosophila sulfurigaster albostrigata]|uniref:protein Aatf n=1 Tax=Drosophila sulfurigaster albostrigata TaxID=89887 RepID=UPI002D21B0F9|nr:protein Aatf [Drosophila sulfurigaster albostrigata]